MTTKPAGAGFDTFYKRPLTRSRRCRLLSGLGGLTGLIATAIGWRQRRHRGPEIAALADPGTAGWHSHQAR